MFKFWKSFIAYLESRGKCPVCGETASHVWQEGGIRGFWRCRCTFYELACNRPTKFGPGCNGHPGPILEWAGQVLSEEDLRAEADRMFEEQVRCL